MTPFSGCLKVKKQETHKGPVLPRCGVTEARREGEHAT